MPADTAACRNARCAARFECFRFMMARDPDHQVYGDFGKDVLAVAPLCEHFLFLRNGDVLRSQEEARRAP